MKDKKFYIFLVLTIVFSFLSATVIFNLVKSYTPVVKYDNPINVVVASKDIPPYSAIRPSQLSYKEIPSSIVPADAVTDIDFLQGKVAKSLILSGDMIRNGHVIKSESTQNEIVAELSSLSDPYTRAVLVPLPEGFAVKQGDRLNIIYTEKNRNSFITKTVFHDVLVLKALEKQAYLALTQDNAERLAHMLYAGQVTYTISPVDSEMLMTRTRAFILENGTENEQLDEVEEPPEEIVGESQ